MNIQENRAMLSIVWHHSANLHLRHDARQFIKKFERVCKYSDRDDDDVSKNVSEK